jgi:hypothetical protein
MTDQPNDSKKPNDGHLTEDDLLLRLLGRRAPLQPIIHEPDSGAPTGDERNLLKDMMFIASQQSYYATFADDDLDLDDEVDQEDRDD